MKARTLILCLFATGCATLAGHPSEPAARFPSKSDLAKLPSKPAPAKAFPTGDVPVESWRFEAEPPADGAPYEDASPWGELFRRVLSAPGHKAVPSPPLRCAAMELARFNLAHKAMPAESLRRFMIARCGAVMPDARPVVWRQAVPARVSDAEVIQAARAGISAELGQLLRGGPKAIGFAALRDAGQLAVVAVIGSDDLGLAPGSRVAGPDRTVSLRGTTRKASFESIAGYINQGEHGVAPCVSNPRIKAPRFALTCRLAPGDSFAWVELLGHEKGRFLDDSIAEIIVHEGDARSPGYKVRSSGAPAPVKDAVEFEGLLLDRVNRVRSAARLQPLARAPRQSGENARLAGTLMDASLGHDDATADRIAMGLLAGWEVDGLIRDGHFFLGTVAPTRDLAVWLDFALERPIGRLALLDPDARQIAVGPAIPGGAPALGAAVTTYSLFESDDHAADEARFLQKLARERAAVGAPPPVRIGWLAELASESALVQKKGKAPFDALGNILHAAAERAQTHVNGWVIETSDLAYIDFPPELLVQGPLQLAVGVTHHRAPGAAWGQYVIFAVVIGGAPLRQAATEVRPAG